MAVGRGPHFRDPPGGAQDLVRVPGWHGRSRAGQELDVQAGFLARFPDGRLFGVLAALDVPAAKSARVPRFPYADRREPNDRESARLVVARVPAVTVIFGSDVLCGNPVRILCTQG